MKNNVLQKDVAILHWTSQNLIDQNERKLFDDCTNNLNFFLKIRFVYIGGEKIKRWRYFHSIRLRGIFKLDVSYNYEKKKKIHDNSDWRKNWKEKKLWIANVVTILPSYVILEAVENQRIFTVTEKKIWWII